MYKVVVVDDEIWIRKEIRSFIEWSGMELELAGEAGNGKEACGLILQNSPHLVVTDIKMPIMDGLELLRWVDEHKIPCKVIVLSGYGDFKFARQAILYHAFDYVLKPFNETELALIFIRAIDEIRQETIKIQTNFHQQLKANKGLSLMRDRFLNRILTDRTMDGNEIVIGCEELNLTLPDQGYHVATVKFFEAHDKIARVYKGDQKLFDFAVRNIIDEWMFGKGLYFQNISKTNEYLLIKHVRGKNKVDCTFYEELRNELEICLKLPVWIGLGGQRKRYDAIFQSYQESLQALILSPLLRTGRLAVYDGENDKSVQRLSYQEGWERLCDLFVLYVDGETTHRRENIIHQLDHLLYPSPPHTVTWKDLKTGFSRLLLTVEKLLLECGGFQYEFTDLLQFLKKDQEELDVDAISIHLSSVLDLLLEGSEKAHARSKSGKELIHVIKKYMDENCDFVTLEGISQTYYINKNYFCSLFKQVTGENFSDYLVNVRMKKAETMLIHSDLKIYEIAGKVGYTDQRYFSQVFRKYHGLRPGEFRTKERELQK
jgi:two-component system response regulator YesN